MRQESRFKAKQHENHEIRYSIANPIAGEPFYVVHTERVKKTLVSL